MTEINSQHDPNFAKNWWKQAQRLNTVPLTKPLIRRKLESKVEELEEQLARKRGKKDQYKGDLEQLGKEYEEVKEQLNSILKKWKFDDKPLTSAEEFLNKFTPWINSQMTFKEEVKEFLTNLKVNNLAELRIKIEGLKEDINQKETTIIGLNNSYEKLESKKEQELKKLETNHNKEKAELAENKTLLEQKVKDQDKALLDLARSKIKGKKDAERLLGELENNWKDKEKELEQNIKDLTELKNNQIKVIQDERKVAQKWKGRVEDKEKELKETKKELEAYEKADFGKEIEEIKSLQQEQLRKINLLFDEKAKDYEIIDFNGLYSLLEKVKAERERERERESKT